MMNEDRRTYVQFDQFQRYETFARIINKSDPLMRKVYLSNLRFRQGYFPATSHILHMTTASTFRQNFKTGFKSSGFGYK